MTHRETGRLYPAGNDSSPTTADTSPARRIPVTGRPHVTWFRLFCLLCALFGAYALLSVLGMLEGLAGKQLWAPPLLATALYLLFVFVIGKDRLPFLPWPRGRGDRPAGNPSRAADDTDRRAAPLQQYVPPGDGTSSSASVPGATPDPDPGDGPGRAPAPSAGHPERAHVLPGPPLFGRSTAGQAPWLLPAHGAQSGLAADAGRLGDLEVRAASVVGAGHRCDEPVGPRQDAYALGRTEDGHHLIVAVADGLSSCPHSDLGARVAVSTSVRALRTMVESGGIDAIDTRLLYQTIAGEMIGTGQSRKFDPKEIRSILITAVIPTSPGPTGMRPVWTSWIGDVSLWLQRGRELCRLTGQEKSGLDRNTLSAVLPFNWDQAEEFHFKLEMYERIAVMSDGLSDSLGEVDGVSGFFSDAWSGAPPHPAAFLHGLCYDAPGQSDDRTAVVVWTGMDRHPSPGQLG